MKKTYLTLLTMTGTAYLFMSNNAGVATVQNKDRTGSPVGEVQLCNNCHSGASFTTSIDLRLLDGLGNTVTAYNPGETYTYEVEVTSSGASAYGFQTVGLLSSTNAQAGSLVALSSNTKTKVLSGRTYGEHTTRSTPGLFKMTWTAPAAGSGEVKFYATGLGCNANSSSSGDKFVKANALVIAENVSTGTGRPAETGFSFGLYPQPLSGSTLYLRSGYTGEGTLTITDLTGRTLAHTRQAFTAGQAVSVDLNMYESGTFIILIRDVDGNRLYSSTFIKQ